MKQTNTNKKKIICSEHSWHTHTNSFAVSNVCVYVCARIYLHAHDLRAHILTFTWCTCAYFYKQIIDIHSCDWVCNSVNLSRHALCRTRTRTHTHTHIGVPRCCLCVCMYTLYIYIYVLNSGQHLTTSLETRTLIHLPRDCYLYVFT